jgi:hypothetical protein
LCQTGQQEKTFQPPQVFSGLMAVLDVFLGSGAGECCVQAHTISSS